MRYFDISEIEDPQYRELVNEKIADLSSQFDKRTRELLVRIEQQRVEVKNMRF